MKKLGTKTIETERLILRRFHAEDAAAMYRNWASDPIVTEYLTWQPHQSVKDSEAVISLWLDSYKDGAFFQWAMEYKETGEPIGSIGVVDCNEESQTAEMGYCMGRSYWGRGLMPEALKAIYNFLFDEVGVEKITAKHDSENPKSGRAMQKAGMRFLKYVPKGGKNNRGIIDIVEYILTRPDRT
ncbi:MAG TPA: N-acetyltransferase [Clostridiales bacterium]|nr:N-acetyltransferase [Clostridiales bacterium]